MVRLGWLIVIAAALRLLSLVPLAIDVDESWFAASAAALERPLDFFRIAPDNKPPGTVWFYWLARHLFDSGSDPRAARALCIALTFFSSLLLGRIVTVTTHSRKKLLGLGRRGWITALLFLLCSALPSPELLAATTETMMLPLICAVMLWLLTALANPLAQLTARGAALCGIALGACLVLKQTAVFFVVPALYGASVLLSRRQLSRGALVVASAAFVAVPLAVALSLGPAELWQWTYVYPSMVLRRARAEFFSEHRRLIVNSTLLALALWPLWVVPSRAAETVRRRAPRGATRLIVLWCLAGFAAVAAGKGAFYHYFTLLVAPLCVLSTLWRKQDFVESFGFRWLALAYVLVCVSASIPALGPFWGTDLPYYDRMGTVIRSLVPEHAKVLVWGGNALPLSASGRRHPGPFVTARFTAPPYIEQSTHENFERMLRENPPELIVDNHERGDSGFNISPHSNPALSRALRQSYSEHRDPSLPWTTFYVKRTPQKTRQPARSIANIEEPHHEFEAMNDLVAKKLKTAVSGSPGQAFRLFANLPERWRSWHELALLLKAWDGLRVLQANGGARGLDRLKLAKAQQELSQAILVTSNAAFGADASSYASRPRAIASRYVSWIENQFRWFHITPPLSYTSWNWITSLALVELQPRTGNRAQHKP